MSGSRGGKDLFPSSGRGPGGRSGGVGEGRVTSTWVQDLSWSWW